MHCIFSLWHLEQFGFSPEHFNFRVPGLNKLLMPEFAPNRVLTALVTRGMELFGRLHLYHIYSCSISYKVVPRRK
jgi:hypothetical protein